MSHIFISYSRKDKDIVDKIVKHCENAGFDVWLDREDIIGGQQWQQRIVQSIKSAKVVLAILSKNSVSSHNVQKEVTLADIAQVPIVPLAVDLTGIPDNLEYQLAGLQIIKFDQTQRQINALVTALNKLNVKSKSTSDKGWTLDLENFLVPSLDFDIEKKMEFDKEMREMMFQKHKRPFTCKNCSTKTMVGPPGFMINICTNCFAFIDVGNLFDDLEIDDDYIKGF